MIRESAVAGVFYPDNPRELQKMIDGFLEVAKPPVVSGRLRALIVPHAGYVYSGPVAAFGYKALQICHSEPQAKNLHDIAKDPSTSLCYAQDDMKFKKIILLGPAHTVGFAGAALSTADEWQTPLGNVLTWQPKNISAPFFEFDLAHQQEHCLEVQLPFLQYIFERTDQEDVILSGVERSEESKKILRPHFVRPQDDKISSNFKIFPVVVGEDDSEAVARELDRIIDDETFIIVSSDLSHYLPYRQAQTKDKETIEAIIKGQITVLEAQGEACGLTPILSLLNLAKKRNWHSQLLDYRNSGDTFGDKDKVVGYAAIAFNND